MDQPRILKFLSDNNQLNIFSIFQTLNKKDKQKLLDEVQKYVKVVRKVEIQKKIRNLNPLKYCQKITDKNYKLTGLKKIKHQEVACFVFAAGDGSRFRFNKPKGLFCIDAQKSLFANLCKWVQAYEMQFEIKVPILFLVSSKNKSIIQNHFKKHQFFKLDPSQFIFLEQEDYPFLDEKMQWILTDDLTIQAGPNGNGDFLSALLRNNTIEFLQKRDIKYLQCFFIDNPLIDPLDPDLLGYLVEEGLDLAFHVFKRDNLNEKVGLICEDGNRHFVVDYMQVDSSVFKKYQDNQLTFSYANSGHFCITIDALASLISKDIDLPYHLVWKSINPQMSAYKVEKFAFDIFPYLNSKALCYEKQAAFAPLKSLADVKEVKRLLKLKNYFIYKKTYQKKPPLNFNLQVEDIALYLKKEAIN